MGIPIWCDQCGDLIGFASTEIGDSVSVKEHLVEAYGISDYIEEIKKMGASIFCISCDGKRNKS